MHILISKKNTMNYSPLVSVIIPNYNHAPYLKERIESVLNQSYSNFEVIILDDCSTDKSRDIIESYRGYEKINLIEYNTTNSGSTFKQWQKGINIAKGEWIWIAESDDVADESFLHELLFNSKEADLVYCNSIIVDKIGLQSEIYGFSNMPHKDTYKEFSKSFDMRGVEFIQKWMIRDNFLPNASAILFKKELVFDNFFYKVSKMKLMGDWLFWIKLLENDSKISYLATPLNRFRFHSNTVRSSKIKLRITEFIYFLEEVKNKELRAKILDTFIYRYLNKSDNIKFSFSDNLKIIVAMIKYGGFFKLIKSKLL